MNIRKECKEQYILALVGAILLADADTQESYGLLVNIKKFAIEKYELSYIAFCYVKYFGDMGDTVESITKTLKRI